MRISNLEVVQHFVNNGVAYGTYLAKFKGIDRVFTRNGDSFGVISYYTDEPVTKCISIINDDIREELLICLKQIGLK